MSGILAKEKAALAKEEGKLTKFLKAVQKFMAKEFLWVLLAVVLAFPLAYLIDYVLQNYMYEVYGDLKIYMNDRPVLLATYLIAIAGIYFARAVAGSIALALKKSKP
ncbi:MAG TPA: hypothetical protein EYN07_07990 [Flavobacteriaceae bacterium]|jgi:hypothetical protein|nr:hypothetical protein [Flavobacteriaceae bacterium]HIB47315.1 hypothetical protein [Flavobacteriaceae bacterium]HIN99166.1 hypothetical protein [Flavobacteriaceae bacterium]|tara:strand:- start:51693 stop:52013 length:321 start_codon:yes stop_codon:yes gene_type:complete